MRLLCLLLLPVLLSGCVGNKSSPYSSDPNKPAQNLTAKEIASTFAYKNAEAKLNAEIKSLKNLTWFQGLMLVGMFAAGLAWILAPSNIKIYCASVFGLCLIMFGFAYGLQEYKKPFSIAVLAAGTGICGYALYQHRKEFFAKQTALENTTVALSEVVAGNEKLKQAEPSIVPAFKAAQSQQSDSTKELVELAKNGGGYVVKVPLR